MARKVKLFGNLFEWLFHVKEQIGGNAEAVVIEIPAEIYYKELAIFTASSLISNAISRSEFKTFRNGKAERGRDYYLLNVSPNRNETSSIFWHRVINKMIREGEALVVAPTDGYLYCADSFCRKEERPIAGDIYDQVTVGVFTFDRVFTQQDSYLFRLDDVNVRQMLDGIYAEYGEVLKAAAKKFRQGNGQKYKLHIDGIKAGDKDFNQKFEQIISKQLKTYLEKDNAVYPEFDGYSLEADPLNQRQTSADDYVKLKKELLSTVAAAFHIPESMMSGSITSMNDIVGSFLTFGVDPYADAITEGLNKRGGPDNFQEGNYYKADTGKIQHRSVFDLAADCSNLISSGIFSIDEIREELEKEPLHTEWSGKHFITKNFEEIERFLKGIDVSAEGGE